MRRGDIYYIKKRDTVVGSEQEAGRPAVIVSNDMCNEYSSCVEVVYLTTQPKKDLPTHVTVRSTGTLSTALCEQIFTICKDRIEEYSGSCSASEMNMIDAALCCSLAISVKSGETESECTE